jgi:hypothetical protein
VIARNWMVGHARSTPSPRPSSAAGLQPRPPRPPASPNQALTAAGVTSAVLAVLANVPTLMVRNAPAVATRSSFPVALILIVVAFLVVQDRIDRKDPKLALAPVYAEPDLAFAPPGGESPTVSGEPISEPG